MSKDKISEGRPFFIYFLSCFASIGGCLFGYDTGIVSGSMLLIDPYFNLSPIWHEILVSGTIAAAAVFALVAGPCTDLLGRKITIMLACVIFTIGAFVMGLAPTKEVLLVGRVVVGMGIGFASMTVPTYVAEVAPPDIRGRLVTLNQLFITIGIVMSAVIAGSFSYLKPDGWRYMLGLAAAPAVIQFLGFLFLPESPRWLVEKGRFDEAKAILVRIRAGSSVEGELGDIMNTVELDRKLHKGGCTLGRVLRTPHVLKALLVGSGLQLFAQLCGINTVIYYSGSIINMSGFPAQMAVWLVLVPNTINFLATFIGMALVDRLGRKILTAASFAGVAVALVLLAVGFQLSAINSPQINKNITEVDINGTLISDECTKYSICEGCINNENCGFCYDEVTAGSCLMHSSDKTFSKSGRCNSTENTDLHFSTDFCPTNYSWMVILGLALFLLAFAPGIGPMVWTITSEIFPLWARSTCVAITTAVNWICNLVVSSTFLTLTETITKYGTFWVFAGVCVLGFVFTLLCVPETKGRSLEEVEELFMSGEGRQLKRRREIQAHLQTASDKQTDTKF